MFDICNKIRRYNNRKKWRRNNTHNDTIISGEFDPHLITVGKATYGGINFLCFDYETKLVIGSYCSISPGVMFIVSADHYLDHLSTFPFKAKLTKENSYEGISKGDILVDDDVWIGYNSIILSGVHIGQGAVVAAGSVVTKDVPPYAVVAGIPAKVIKYRFTQEIINRLMMIKYNRLNDDIVKEHISELYENISKVDQIDKWIEILS